MGHLDHVFPGAEKTQQTRKKKLEAQDQTRYHILPWIGALSIYYSQKYKAQEELKKYSENHAQIEKVAEPWLGVSLNLCPVDTQQPLSLSIHVPIKVVSTCPSPAFLSGGRNPLRVGSKMAIKVNRDLTKNRESRLIQEQQFQIGQVSGKWNPAPKLRCSLVTRSTLLVRLMPLKPHGHPATTLPENLGGTTGLHTKK